MSKLNQIIGQFKMTFNNIFVIGKKGKDGSKGGPKKELEDSQDTTE
jgi:hypothetical protein